MCQNKKTEVVICLFYGNEDWSHIKNIPLKISNRTISKKGGGETEKDSNGWLEMADVLQKNQKGLFKIYQRKKLSKLKKRCFPFP